MIWTSIVIGTILILVTILIHSLATRYLLYLVKRKHNTKRKHLYQSTELRIAVIVLILLMVTILESSIWAQVYMMLDAFQTFEEALYFSIVTFTTLGYGDITLNESWRLLASIEAAIGIIIFGWSTAIIIAAVQRLILKQS